MNATSFFIDVSQFAVLPLESYGDHSRIRIAGT